MRLDKLFNIYLSLLVRLEGKHDSWGNREFQTLNPWFPLKYVCIHQFFPKYAPVSTPSSYCIISDTGPFWLQGHRTTQNTHCAVLCGPWDNLRPNGCAPLPVLIPKTPRPPVTSALRDFRWTRKQHNDEDKYNHKGKKTKTKAITKAKSCEEGRCLKPNSSSHWEHSMFYTPWKITMKNFLLIFNETLKV